MSRAQLLECARRLNIPADVRRDGKRGSKDNNWLRTDIIERTYGPGFEWRFKSAAAADETMQRITAANVGDLGTALKLAQQALRGAMTDMMELRRHQALKRRKWAEEERLTKSIAQWLGMCDAAQRMHEVELDMRNAGYDLAPVEADAKALVHEQYGRYVERTAAARAKALQ
jgi:hypothetical protein